MYKAICINKIKNKTGKIIQYELESITHTPLPLNMCILFSEDLKAKIKSGYIKVINLKLTKNDHLIDYNGDDLLDKNAKSQLNKQVLDYRQTIVANMLGIGIGTGKDTDIKKLLIAEKKVNSLIKNAKLCDKKALHTFEKNLKLEVIAAKEKHIDPTISVAVDGLYNYKHSTGKSFFDIDTLKVFVDNLQLNYVYEPIILMRAITGEEDEVFCIDNAPVMPLYNNQKVMAAHRNKETGRTDLTIVLKYTDNNILYRASTTKFSTDFYGSTLKQDLNDLANTIKRYL